MSLLSIISKVFEKCLYKHVYNFIFENQIITLLQSGFRSGDNTIYQLLEVYNTISKALDEGKEVRAVFCDISKAFDRVWHKGLLHMMHAIGIRGDLLAWFKLSI